MEQTEKERERRWVPVWIACGLLVGAAMWASTLLPTGGDRAAVGEPTAAGFPQVLTVRDGQLVLLAEPDGAVAERYEVFVRALPEEEQRRLAAGVTVNSEEELAALLEDYTG